MKNLIKENVGLIKICSVVLFVALMAFNVVITQNTNGNTNVDLSLSGLKAMALGSGEGGTPCFVGGCGQNQVCESGECVDLPSNGDYYGCNEGHPNKHCAIWDVTYETGFEGGLPVTTVTCSTGGNYICE